MVAVTGNPPALSGDLELFHTTDPLLYNAPIVVFYGPAASIGSASSRIQVHVFTPAGLESYTRLAISPSSPFYCAVNALPREEQGDEVCRGIAFGLSRYFAELPKEIKECWTRQASAGKRPASPFGLFSPTHVAVLASRMTKVVNTEAVIQDIQRSLGEHCMSWLDVDIVLPSGSIKPTDEDSNTEDFDSLTEEESCQRKYGKYGALINAFGETSFLPTTRMKRAPSKPTAIGRSQTYRQGQREMVRKEMCELVDTESSYVQKMTELVQDIAQVMRAIKGDPAIPVKTAAERAISKLFPSTLDHMLEINTSFLNAIKGVLDETEEDAINEIERDSTNSISETLAPNDGASDPIGILAFAKCLMDHLPAFKDDYARYMNSHAKFPSLMKDLTSSSDPALTDAVQGIGEQRLMSMLIEPIQRLPRYTLYIDTISKQLPVGHPALKPLLKARDIVTDICTSDSSDIVINIDQRLKSLVQGWERGEAELGRLIAAVDVTEVSAPYDKATGKNGILLLFTDRLAFVEKTASNSPSARALQAEIEKPAALEYRDSARPQTPGGLLYAYATDLNDAYITEAIEGQAINIFTRSVDVAAATLVTPPAVFYLEGTYSGKAMRFLEEITKARVESRFEEVEREGGKWDVRSAVAPTGELSLFAAVFEDSSLERTRAGDVRIVVEPQMHTGLDKLEKLGVQTMISVTLLDEGICQISVDSIHGLNTRDKVNIADFSTALSRRLAILLQMELSHKSPIVMPSWIARNEQTLRSLHLLTAEALSPAPRPATEAERPSRPHSPVKQLSSFLSKSIGPHSSGPPQPRKIVAADAIFTDAPSLQPAGSQLPRPASKDARETSRPTSHEQPQKNSPLIPAKTRPTTASKRVEETLTTYLLALQARKGNVVGRVVKARASADELAVNDLYNSLLDDPNMMVLAAQTSVDVLFCAFEKFLNGAWKEEFGQVVPERLMESVQEKAESSFPVDFEAFFRDAFHGMPPPNQRALRGIVKLLAELLDGTGNDGDRGILTAAFAELLVPGNNPYSYVSLIDRFVEDIESLFGEVVHVREIESMSSPHLGHDRSRSVNTGSLTSNTSSLRKKFGFGGPSRESARLEPESRAGSVWRTLSKNNKPTSAPEPTPATPRMTVQRAKSIDADSRLAQKRPLSQDVPTALPAFSFEKPKPKEHSFLQGSPLSTIGETTPGAHARKKRRSSLSDLTLLQSPGNTPLQSPAGTKTLNAFIGRDSPIASSLSRATGMHSPTRLGSPTRNVARSRLPATFTKENSPCPKTSVDISLTALPRPRVASKQPDEVVITANVARKRNDSISGIPSSSQRSDRASSVQPTNKGLSERPTSGNAQKIRPSGIPEKNEKSFLLNPSPASTPTRKLRMQSPQKLRERLQAEQKAIASGQSALETELAKIGDDLGALGPGRMGSVRGVRPLGSTTDLNKRLAELSSLVTSTLAELQTKTEGIQSDLTSSLTVSESKARKLDELYREANAENEALYARFNEELGKVVKAVRAGDGVEELRRRVKDGNEERDRLRRENARLKREVLGLRSQLKE